MQRLFWLGVTIAMTACSVNPPENAGKPSYATHGDQVRPSPTQVPAEIDPPPVPAPGSEPAVAPPPAPPAEVDPPQVHPDNS